jgi:hypothetical protein
MRGTFVIDKDGKVLATFASPDLGTPRAKSLYEDELAKVSQKPASEARRPYGNMEPCAGLVFPHFLRARRSSERNLSG